MTAKHPLNTKLLTTLTTIILLSCGKSPTDEIIFESDIRSSRTVDGWLLEATVKKSVYRRGESVEFSFTITNNAKESRGAMCSSGCQFFWNIYKDAEMVYSLEKHIFCATWITSWSLDPGKSRIESGRWDQKNDAGNKVTPGKYQLEMYLCGLPHTIKIFFEIQ